ncbi:MAG: alpha/beta hydrolase [Marmoricola sp.]
MSMVEAFKGRVLRSLMGLPRPVLSVLAGKQIQIEGQGLAPELQLMLRLQRVLHEPAAEDLPWAEARAALALQSRLVGGLQPVGATRDIDIPGPGGPLNVRLYTPTSRLREDSIPTILFIHGGGMVYGGEHGTHDLACRFLAEQSGVQVLSVDYRLAPEHPYPAGLDDCKAAYTWMVENAASIGADVDRLAVGGDSAGGYFSAAVAVYAAEQGLPLKFQLLIYPCTDFVNLSASRETFGEGFFLTKKFMDQAQEAYLGSADPHDPDISVLYREVFPEGLAPVYLLTAGFDPLRDEGEAYARLLAEHGVEVRQRRYPSMIHGFFNMVGAGHEALAYNRETAEELRRALG